MNRTVAGSGVQSWTDPATAFAVRPGLGCLKFLNTARSIDRVRRFHELNPNAPVIYRLVAGDDLAGLPTRTEQSIRDTDDMAALLGDLLFVEVAINEAYQAGVDLNRLSDATIKAVALLAGAGRRPVVGNFSVGNPQLASMFGAPARMALSSHHDLATPAVKRPPNLNVLAVRKNWPTAVAPSQGDWARFVPALQAAVAARGVLGLHEYGVPDRWLDVWLNMRYAKALDEIAALGVTIQVGIGEHGIDHGVVDGRLAGWRDASFHLTGAEYAGLLDQTLGRYAADPRVAWVALFEGGPYEMWQSFGYDDEEPVRQSVVRVYPVSEIPTTGATVDYPTATWVPSPNFGYPKAGTHGRSGQRIDAIVHHIADGTGPGTISWFKSPASQSSSHYLIDEAGKVWQFVREDDAAWTNGIDFPKGYNAYHSDLNIPMLADCWSKGINPNLRTITIEYAGKPSPGINTVQYTAGVALDTSIRDRRKIVAGPATLLGHFQIDAVTRAYCPGPTFPWARLFADLKITMTLPSATTYEDQAAGPVYRAANFLSGTGDVDDARIAGELRRLLNALKAHHGMQVTRALAGDAGRGSIEGIVDPSTFVGPKE